MIHLTRSPRPFSVGATRVRSPVVAASAALQLRVCPTEKATVPERTLTQHSASQHPMAVHPHVQSKRGINSCLHGDGDSTMHGSAHRVGTEHVAFSA